MRKKEKLQKENEDSLRLTSSTNTLTQDISSYIEPSSYYFKIAVAKTKTKENKKNVSCTGKFKIISFQKLLGRDLITFLGKVVN